MTPEQAAFRDHGWVHLPGALRQDVVRPIKAHVLNELKRQQIWSTGRTLSKRLQGVPVFQQIGKLGQLIHYPGLEDKLVSSELYSLMRRLADANLAAEQEAQLLISLPHKVDWTLEGLNWHRDISSPKPGPTPGVQVFALIDDLAPHGGATLALAGSHRLKSQFQGKQIVDKLAESDAGRSTTVGGIEVSILEMAGRAGDVYLMDMRLLHTPSINATQKPRIMATIRYLTEVKA